jgi:hypothetical protein
MDMLRGKLFALSAIARVALTSPTMALARGPMVRINNRSGTAEDLIELHLQL